MSHRDPDFEHALCNQIAIVVGFCELLLAEVPHHSPLRPDLVEIHKAALVAVKMLRAEDPGQCRSLTEADLRRSMPPDTLAAPSEVPVKAGGVDLRSRERDHIVEVLQAERGNKSAAAAKLGLSRRTLYRRMRRHQLPLGKTDH